MLFSFKGILLLFRTERYAATRFPAKKRTTLVSCMSKPLYCLMLTQGWLFFPTFSCLFNIQSWIREEAHAQCHNTKMNPLTHQCKWDSKIILIWFWEPYFNIIWVACISCELEVSGSFWSFYLFSQISHFSGSSSTQNPGEVENSHAAVFAM